MKVLFNFFFYKKWEKLLILHDIGKSLMLSGRATSKWVKLYLKYFHYLEFKKIKDEIGFDRDVELKVKWEKQLTPRNYS